MATVIPAICANAEVTVGKLRYDITQFWGHDAPEAVVVGFKEGYTPYGTLTIPETIPYEDTEIKVVGIGWEDFSSHETDEPAIKDHPGITAVKLPSGIRFIGSEEFLGCSGITSYTVAKDNTDFKTIGGALCETSYSSWSLFRYPSAATSPTYTPPSEVDYISKGAFAANTHLKKIYLVGYQWLDAGWHLGNGSIEEVDGSNSDRHYYMENGALYYGNSLYAYCPGNSCDVFTVSDHTDHITSGAFCGAKVRKVVIPASVDGYTGEMTFRDSEVEEIEAACPAPYDIGENCFRDCANLKSVISLGASKSGELTIDAGAFKGCKSLATVTIAPEVKQIELWQHAFDGCESLTDFPVTLDMKITRFSHHAFAGCKSLTSFKLSTVASAEAFDNKGYQFAGSGLTSVNWPSVLPEVPQGCFEGCEALVKASLKMTTKLIKADAFRGSGLTGISMMGVGWYDRDAFADCAALRRVYFPANDESYIMYKPLFMSLAPSQVIVNHRNLNYLYDQPESPGIWLYVSSSNGGMKIGDGWGKVYVPGKCADLYRSLTASEVVEMYSYETYPEQGAVGIGSLAAGVKITSVIIEGKEAVLADGLYKAEGVSRNDGKLDVTVNYTVSNNVMTTSYEYAYSAIDGLESDHPGRETDAPVEWYTLSGRRVAGDNLPSGIYLRRQGSRAEKVVVN